MTDTVNNKHPSFSEFVEDWITMRHTYRGSRVIKDQSTVYLPPTGAHREDGYPNVNTVGYNAYHAYKDRAIFHEFVSDAVEGALGVMHMKPPVIELPEQLEFMRDNATANGESLEQLLRRINEQQLVAGRLGLLVDLPASPSAKVLPYIALYQAEAIINWDDALGSDLRLGNLNLVVLNESGNIRKNIFTWDWEERYRVLLLGDATENEGKGEAAAYKYGVFAGANATFNEAVMATPSIGGNVPGSIPFVFINSKDIIPSPDDPPLKGLADLSISAYRAEADYQQNLYMQGQDTLVTSGFISEDADKALRTGAGARIDLPMGGTAEYIGVSSEGLSEQRTAIENLLAEAGQKGGQLLDSTSRQKESGDALAIRVSSRTATLQTVALSGAAGLERSLRHAAEWVGADPSSVVVTPNLDFVDDQLDSRSLAEYMTAKTMGAPISNQTIHSIMEKKGVTEIDFEEEMALIAAEEPLIEGDDRGVDDEDEDEDENDDTNTNGGDA